MRSKLLKRDFNEELEEIAESKGFEKEAQNLLLSMLYKVDNAYNDYQTVKREVPYKEEFLENILKIVKINCKEIEIAKPNSILEKQLENTKCKILEEDKENREQKLIIFPNEKVVLYSVIKAGLEKINPDLNLEEKAILTAIQIGKCISYSEVIRDFNGYSWSSVINEIENIECNVIYTDLIYLIGEERVNNLNSSNISKIKDYISSELYEEIKKVAINFYFKYNENERSQFENKIVREQKQLEEMTNQKEFVEKITKIKKNMLAKIKEIDEELNNQELLRKKYIETNKELPNEKKIFSISHYEEKIQNDRKQILNQIEEYNKLLKPIQFVKIKTELENKIEYYNDLSTIDIVKMQEIFINQFYKLVNNVNDKVQLLDYIYKIRYLKYLPISKTCKMKDKIDFSNIEKEIISKGISIDLITRISNNIETDYALLKGIFNTRNVNLEDLSIVLSVEDGRLESKVYDGETLDNTNFIELNNNSNVQIRKTKKVRIFN